MTQVFDENNRIVPVTVVKAGPCVVTQIRTREKDGYSAVQLAYGRDRPARRSPSRSPAISKRPASPRAGTIVELRTDALDGYEIGQELGPDVFDAGADGRRHRHDQGQGHRWGHEAARLPRPRRGHGTQRKHRAPGSIGACATPARVFKGVRMAGRMGHERQTTPGLTVHKVDTETGPAADQGCAFPAPRAALVIVRTAAKGA